jgi:hypothetical protein
MIRKLSLLASTAMMLLSGTALSADTAEGGKVKLLAYLPISDRLLADPSGPALPRLFQRSFSTVHIASGPITQFPPSPCRVYAATWNNIVATIPPPQFAATGGDSDFEEAYAALSNVIALQAISLCNFDMVRDTSTSRIISIMPVP